MPATYDSIVTTAVASNTVSFNIDNIPGTFTDLILILELIPVTNDDRNIFLRFNGDAGTNYSDQEVYAIAAGAGTQTIANNTNTQCGRAVGFGQSAVDSGRSILITQIMSYANTNFHKVVLHQGFRNSYGNSITTGCWRSTSAITSITVGTSSPQSIKAGSRVSLYGIKAA